MAAIIEHTDPRATPRWYPVYTHPRAEKRVYSRMLDKGFEVFLPLIRTLRQWSDRKKWVEVPMFNSYIFVRIDFKDHDKVLQVPGAVRFIYFSGSAAWVPENQIGWLKAISESKYPVEVTRQDFEPGEKVEIREGPFRGISGELLSRKGGHLFLVRITGINYNLLLEVEQHLLKKTLTSVKP